MANAAAERAGAPSGAPAFELGWLMAQAYGPLLHRPAKGEAEHLPTSAELSRADQAHVLFAEVEALLGNFDATLSVNDVREKFPASGGTPDDYLSSLQQLNLDLLTSLSVKGTSLVAAYQFGRALSDTCWLPDAERGYTFFLQQFDRHRVATLQAWVSQASAVLPGDTGAIMSKSLDNWQAWATANEGTLRRQWPTTERSVVASLRSQSHTWRGLLSGNTEATTTPDIDAWVHAGESLLRTAQRLGRLLVTRFWPVLVVILAAVGGLMYLSLADSAGTAKAWTSIATVAGGLGITGVGIRTAANRATGAIGESVTKTVTIEAHAWEVTLLPALKVGVIRHARLRRAGLVLPGRQRTLSE